MENKAQKPNRATRRKKTKLRLTKPVKRVRKKVMYGRFNITEHSSMGMSPIEYMHYMIKGFKEFVQKHANLPKSEIINALK